MVTDCNSHRGNPVDNYWQQAAPRGAIRHCLVTGWKSKQPTTLLTIETENAIARKYFVTNVFKNNVATW